MNLVSLLLVGCVPLVFSKLLSSNANDINLSFRREMVKGLAEADFNLAIEHDAHVTNKASVDETISSEIMIACTTYNRSRRLQRLLSQSVGSSSFHPVFSSAKKDRACYSLVVDSPDAEILVKLEKHNVALSAIPSAIKLDESVERLLQNIEKGRADHFVLEIGVGLGVNNKGVSGSDNRPLAMEIIAQAEKILMERSMLDRHWSNLFWTSSRYAQSANHDKEKRSRFMSSAKTECSFKDLQVEHSMSHVTISQRQVNSESGGCMLFLASVASLRKDVIVVSAHGGAVIQAAKSTPWEEDPDGPTDQNAWVQSGNSIDTPYSDIGVDGSNYVLGIVDSGADDLSCFLIDSTGEQTTRTSREDYANPITEEGRRKVIQYVAWGDGSPSYDYDHGTWCSGSALGQCINQSTGAKQYDGVAPNAKMTMFDIDIAATDNFLNVPSLYDIALPPAYSAGARVHSDSWGTPGMNTYTSKSIDVDQFMFENPDFLFIVAAANDGDYGYHSVGSPGVSKSALTVGATSVDHDYLVYFSSIGENYDGAIKPNIVAPGRNLMSAGVHNGGANWSDSCNVQLSSGTSMATPITAGSALLARHYLESPDFWGSYCNSNYASCPVINPKADSNFISGALLKAVLIHGAKGLKGAESTPDSVVPAQNLTTPPDLWQGWGQVLLGNVLPIPGVYDFDLFLADYESISSLQQRTYVVDVTNVDYPLRATIVWTDEVNVVWAAKSLLNDLDLTVVSPSGDVIYGNNIKGDEFNPVERVVIDVPEVGEYKVIVTSKIFPSGNSQNYGVVISSGGSVTASATVDISTSEVNYEEDRAQCEASGENSFLRFQLEDWEEGSSWTGLDFNLLGSSGDVVDSCTFVPNEDLQIASFNRIYQCTFCLPVNTTYTASLDTASVPNGSQVRVASSQCNVYLSHFQESQSVTLDGEGNCNYCSEEYGLLTALMFANVTDDDYTDYSW